MTILSESVSLSSEGDLVEIRYSSVVKNAAGIHPLTGSLWIERRNISWLCGTIEHAVGNPEAEAAAITAGDDNLRVVIGGHEAEPYVNVFNKRVGDVLRSGTYWIAPSTAFASRLVQELIAAP